MCFTVFISFSSLRVQPTSPFLLYYCSEFVYDTSSFRLFFKLCNVGIIAGSCSTLLIILCSKTCLHLRQRSGGFFSSVNVNQEIRFLKWMQLIFDVCLVYFLMLKGWFVQYLKYAQFQYVGNQHFDLLRPKVSMYYKLWNFFFHNHCHLVFVILMLLQSLKESQIL